MKKIAALTLGCKVNEYDTQAMLNIFTNRGYEIKQFDEKADIYLINTCTVTNLGDKKSRQMLRRAKAMNPNSIVIAAGCYSQVAPEEVAAIDGVNIVIGNKDRYKIVDLVESFDEETGETLTSVSNLRYEKVFEELELESTNAKTRAFLKIQEGCNEFCTYCIIPYSRGRNRSREFTNIIKEAERLARAGYKELVLTGIHIASYGADNGEKLIDIVRELHKINGIERIRLSSVEPKVMTDEFVSGIKDLEKVCDHFHLSLQSGSDRILKLMNRKYTTNEFRESVRKIRSIMPNAAITTDIIVGFPGETKEDFIETYEFAKEINFADIHVFPYAAKKGTKSYNFKEHLTKEQKQSRVHELIKVRDKGAKEFKEKFVGQNMQVLFETDQKGKYIGLTTNYIKVSMESVHMLTNQIKNITLTEEILI
ncbi:MAG: tRNA (N(6)-L-threonylcarbamoyladenosine(37)-C(2))-methylthiotransferase MtaB [Defluviitaleaceae bacterium]|nr:tRNA (N(6)-L-threonylcarbamoyladenosine(37)-C(2))-methylthiotransferase MtaB [Defluviitaleaceae bacterium]